VLLQIADSSITYRTRYLGVLRTEFVLKVLLVDESNPRSVAFQLASLLHQIARLQESDKSSNALTELPLVNKALSAVRSANPQDLARPDATGRLGGLESLIREVKTDLYQLSDTLAADYLNHLTTSYVASSS
jgi:uncharacterized alpha-E superfamily protein